MDVLSNILSTFKVQARIFHNGQICGEWQIDTSGSHKAVLHAVTHGTCELLFKDGAHHESSLTVGDVVLLPRDLQCRICSAKEVTTKLNIIESKPFAEGLQNDSTGLVCAHIKFEHHANNFLFDMLPECIVIKGNEMPWKNNLKPLIDVLIYESISENPGVQETLNRLVEMAIMIVIRASIEDESNYLGFAAALRDPKFYKVLDAIHNNPSNEWTNEELAKITSMSKSAFISKFKSLLGETPINYVAQWRMKAAYKWFRDDNITIAEAAERCGYQTEAAFSKAFKRELSVSPGKVRAGEDSISG